MCVCVLGETLVLWLYCRHTAYSVITMENLSTQRQLSVSCYTVSVPSSQILLLFSPPFTFYLPSPSPLPHLPYPSPLPHLPYPSPLSHLPPFPPFSLSPSPISFPSHLTFLILLPPPLFPLLNPRTLYSSCKIQRGSNGVEISSDSTRASVTFSPFKVDFHVNNEIGVVLNSRGLLNFEHHRNKRK